MSYKKLYLIPWIGGKYYVSNYLIPYVPEEKFRRWCEPFGGAGGMLMAKKRWAKQEIWNDSHSELYNLWKVIQTQYDEFVQFLWFEVKSRDVFHYWKNLEPDNDVERAYRFWYLLNYSFGADGRYFALHERVHIGTRCDALWRRIQQIWFENKDYTEFFSMYATAQGYDQFWYIDPPYDGGSTNKEYNEKRFDHEKLAELCGTLPCRWLQTNSDTPRIRELYKDYCLVPFERANKLENRWRFSKNETYRELMIANYDLNEVYRKNTTKGQQTLWTD